MVKGKTYTKRVTVLLTDDEAKKLDEYCREKGLSLSAVARLAIKEFLEKEEKP
jgi:predicted transcriptional regulator